MKFIHTADWQIGMKAIGMGKAAAVVRDSRIHAIENIFEAAKKNDAEFILVCGDVFEDNQVSIETVKKVISIFNKYPEMPIYLLPGNHDYLGPGSVYNQPIFSKVSNLVIFKDSKLVRHNDVTLYPAPIEINKRAEDPTICIPDTSKVNGIKIGVSHGSYEGSFYSEQKIEFPIRNSCIERTRLDYIALGHHHNMHLFDIDGITRIAYSGTHEQTSFNETSSGFSLLVEISSEDKIPRITPIKTGKLDWGLIDFSFSDKLSLTKLSEMLDNEKTKSILKLRLDGKLPFNLKGDVDNLIEFHDTQHTHFKVEFNTQYVVPTDISQIIEINDPIVKRAAELLRYQIEKVTDHEKHAQLVNCLGCLYQTVKEASQ